MILSGDDNPGKSSHWGATEPAWDTSAENSDAADGNFGNFEFKETSVEIDKTSVDGATDNDEIADSGAEDPMVPTPVFQHIVVLSRTIPGGAVRTKQFCGIKFQHNGRSGSTSRYHSALKELGGEVAWLMSKHRHWEQVVEFVSQLFHFVSHRTLKNRDLKEKVKTARFDVGLDVHTRINRVE